MIKCTQFYCRIIKIRKMKNIVFLVCIVKMEIIQLSYSTNKDFHCNFRVNDLIKVKGKWILSSKGIRTLDIEEIKIIASNFIKKQKNNCKYMINETQRKVMFVKNLIYRVTRNYLESNDFMEVYTSILEKKKDSSSAKAFKVIGERNEEIFFLRRNYEKIHKKILGNLLCDIFQFEKIFRNQGKSRTTMPEYEMLDIYKIDADYFVMMDILENIICELLSKMNEKGYSVGIDISVKIERKEFSEFINEYFGRNMNSVSQENSYILDKELRKKKIKIDKISYYEKMDKFFGIIIKPQIRNSIVYNFPSCMAPLAKKCDANDNFSEEFKYIVSGISIAHAYTEETKLENMLVKLEQQAKSIKTEIDKDFIDIFAFGMPPIAGLGIGLNRLLSVILDIRNVRDTILV